MIATVDNVQQRITARVQHSKPGAVFTPRDFLDLGGRAAVDQALGRLAKRGTVQRIGRGLYYSPRQNIRFGIDVPPDLDDVAEALGRQTGSRIAPSGAAAANRLGLSTQVPAKPLYLSDGRSRSVAVGNYTIRLKHVPSRMLPTGSRISVLVLQALQFLGRAAIDDDVIEHLRDRLSPSDRRHVLRDSRYAPAWLAEIARKVAADPEPAHG